MALILVFIFSFVLYVSLKKEILQNNSVDKHIYKILIMDKFKSPNYSNIKEILLN